jgi:hypothetical protein
LMSDREFRRKNHFVPETYLKRWAGPDGRVSVYRLLVSHSNVPVWDRKFPSGLARHRHLYTRAAAEAESDAIERWLDEEFESPAAVVLAKATTDARLSRDDYVRLVRFLAAQDVRTPARFLEIVRQGNDAVQEVMQSTLERAGREIENAIKTGVAPQTPKGEHLHDFPARVRIAPGDGGATTQLHLETAIGRGYWHFAMKQLLTRTIEHLLEHRWTILRGPAGLQWTTSDDPVVKLNWYGPDSYDFKGGWGSSGTEIFLPIGPQHLLYTRIGVRQPRRGTVVSIQQARQFQDIIVRHASRLVFAVAPDPVVESIRLRRVDASAFKQEAEQWRRWQEEQSAAERALLS